MNAETEAAIRRGLTEQLAQRRDLLASDAKPIGWKAGLGAPAAMEQHGLDGPVPGYLTDRYLLAAGESVSLDRGVRLHAEPEMAVRARATITDALSDEEIAAAVGATAPAIEVIDPDFDAPLSEALAGDIFHRAVVLGEFTETMSAAHVAGWRADVIVDGRPVHTGVNPADLSGAPVFVLRHLARALSLVDMAIEPGDVVILGSMAPPVAIANVKMFEVRSTTAGAVLQVGGSGPDGR
ncbi:MAG: fumarylacetoacetate hydrolase family protein [Actinobacteria bacterium]|nr:fumarylacetoacetate hydrolase family protein [Actinomycetota bacterium]